MTTPTTAEGLAAAPAADVHAAVAACRQRAIEREGIPMFVALHDARPGRRLQVRDEWCTVEGARLVALLDHYERGLDALPRDPAVEAAGVEGAVQGGPLPDLDPTGAAALVDVLVVLAEQHLRASPGSPWTS